jgi:hypothetical protein
MTNANSGFFQGCDRCLIDREVVCLAVSESKQMEYRAKNLTRGMYRDRRIWRFGG